jgi:hypothetical protein
MQPARADVVHHLTFPASAAIAGVRHGTFSMSIPWWLPCTRGSPKFMV